MIPNEHMWNVGTWDRCFDINSNMYARAVPIKKIWDTEVDFVLHDVMCWLALIICVFSLILDEPTECFMGSQKGFYNHVVSLLNGFLSKKKTRVLVNGRNELQ